MKTTFKSIAIALLVSIFIATVALTAVQSNKASAVRDQNRLLQTNIDKLGAQNELLRENKMCLAFNQAVPVVPVPPMQ